VLVQEHQAEAVEVNSSRRFAETWNMGRYRLRLGIATALVGIVAAYYFSFYFVRQRGSISYLEDDLSTIRLRIYHFHENPSVNAAIFSFYYPMIYASKGRVATVSTPDEAFQQWAREGSIVYFRDPQILYPP
jgi:hypothetical protein